MSTLSVLEKLAAEISVPQKELHSRLLATDETLTPNYFYVDASGQVHAVFTGGIDILANQGAFSSNNHVAWRDTVPGGTLDAEIAGYKGAGGGFPNQGLVVATPSIAAGGNNHVAIQIDNGGSTPGTERISLFTGGWAETLKRGDGWSEYQYNPIINTDTIIGGPTFPGASNSVIAGPYNFTLGGPKRALVTFDSLIQHNGVAGVTYTIYIWVLIDSTAFYFGSFTGNNSGWNAPLSGAVVSQQLNAGSHSIQFMAVETASPTFGIYDWSFSVGILPTSFPVGTTI